MSVDIFEYTDFKLFLREAYEAKKKEWKHFSHRYIAQKGEFSSGYFAKLSQGQSSLTPDKVPVIAEIFGLFGDRREYFRVLALYNQAKSETDREKHYFDLNKIRKSYQTLVGDSQLKYFSQWYYAVVREVAQNKTLEELKFAGESIFPPVNSEQLSDALELLLELNLLVEEEGRFQKRDRVLSSGDEAMPKAVASFANQSLELCQQALYDLPKKDRRISALVLNISKEGKSKVESLINQCRQQVLDIAMDDRNVDQVMHVNLSHFLHLGPQEETENDLES